MLKAESAATRLRAAAAGALSRRIGRERCPGRRPDDLNRVKEGQGIPVASSAFPGLTPRVRESLEGGMW